nr:twin-arginine translocase TatA/TatE family subunit [Sedimentibacter sp.]
MKIGTTELMVILGIAVLIFGPTKLPQLGKAVGQTINNFKRSSTKAEKEES